MGGKPNPGTPADKRLKENKPKAVKPASPPPPPKVMPMPKPKGGK